MSRLMAFARRTALATLIASLGLSAGLSQADDTAPATKIRTVAAEEPAADETFYKVPETDNVKTLTEFLNKVKGFRPSNREEYINHIKHAPDAMKAAAEKILKLEKDPNSPAARAAEGVLLSVAVQGLQGSDPATHADVLKKVKDFIAASDKTQADLQLAFGTASGLEYGGSRDLAAKAYAELGELLTKSKDPEVVSTAETLIGAARRLNLIGNELVLEGTTMDGKPFNINSLRGKVVLVDFWATWCGPCIAEYPNILANYEAYHKKGFDVVGVSLDSDREALEKYIAEKHVPWVTLHEKEGGGQHPAAKYYGVLGIPTVILINKEGKVISLNARGPELGKLLEKELGPVEKPAE